MAVESHLQFSLINPYRDDPKPRVDCDRHEDMDAAHSRIELQFEATKASFPCKCKNCPQMARPEEQVCCLGESQWQDLYNTGGDFKCILDCPNFQNICNIDHFRVIKDFRNSIFHDDNEEEPLNRRLRIAAYRSTAFFLRGKLGRGNRIVIPACIKEKIRELCPNPPNIPYEGHSSR